jgi:hypothetical protein
MTKKVAPVVEARDLSALITEFKSKKVSKLFDYDGESDRRFLPDILVAIQRQLDRVGVGHHCVHVMYDLSDGRILLLPGGDLTDEVLAAQFEGQMGLWVKEDIRKGMESYIQWSFEMLPLQRRIDSLQSEVERLKRGEPPEGRVHPLEFFGPFGPLMGRTPWPRW